MNKDNENELLPVVDLQGIQIGQITRGMAHDGVHRGLHPVVHLHLFNSEGELYLQHRPAWKLIQPDRWDTAVGGHIGYGEGVAEALRREVCEEIGLDDLEPVFLGKYLFETARERELVYVYRAVSDGVVRPSEEELAGGRFFGIEEIRRRMGHGFFTPNFESEFTRFERELIGG